MASPPGDSCVQACPNCGTLVDISEQEPLAKFDCPNCGAPMRASRKYNHFSVIEHLGTGGMGAVYKALDRNLNRMVALKLLRKELSADDAYIGKLEDEARITASINHPFVVKVFSFGHDTGQYYIAMELVDKGSLDDLMQLQGRIAELQVLQVGLQVASGLQAANEKGLIHRDVKPGNILFADAHTAKITDFGLALLAEHEADARGEIWGTPYYIAPEKLNNEPEDFRSDIYSLGGTLFHAVAGRPPFEAETASMVALKHLKSRAVSLQAFAPDASSETAYVINRMLHKDPNQRYNSYAELTDHFRYAIDKLNANVGKGRASRERVVVESQSQNNLAGILTLVLLVLVVAAGIAAIVFRDRLFGTGAPPGAGGQAAANPLSATADAKVSPNAAYESARHQVVEEKYADAQESFRALAQQTNLDQPLTDWVRVHQGMLALLNHQETDARAIFGNLQKAGLFTRDAKQHELANFFVEAGRFLSESSTVPASAVKSWNKNNFEALALLLFGLKDWEQADFEDANAFFEAFLDGKPGDPYRWINDYSPIARKAVHDYAIYAPLRDRLKSGTADRAGLQADFAKARGQFQTSGKLVEAFFTAETDLGNGAPPVGVAPGTSPTPGGHAAASATPTPSPQATPPLVSASTATTREHDVETVRWQTAREQYQQMLALGRFDEAASVLEHVSLSDLEYVHARGITLLRARTLVAFKKTLVNDLNTPGGYPQPVTSRRGTTYPRGIMSATADMVQAGTPYGTIGVPWNDFAPVAYLGIANYYADAARDPKQAAERRWLAAIYALENGRPVEAKSFAARAVRDLPQHQKDLEQFNAPAGTGNPAGISP